MRVQSPRRPKSQMYRLQSGSAIHITGSAGLPDPLHETACARAAEVLAHARSPTPGYGGLARSLPCPALPCPASGSAHTLTLSTDRPSTSWYAAIPGSLSLISHIVSPASIPPPHPHPRGLALEPRRSPPLPPPPTCLLACLPACLPTGVLECLLRRPSQHACYVCTSPHTHTHAELRLVTHYPVQDKMTK
jgi:hypothetical protein